MRELSRFIEPLRQKIAAMGREDDEKLAKMRRLLEILCNPSKRLPMDTLKKCEAVLNRMQQTQDLGGVSSDGYRVTHHVGPNLPLTPKPRLRFSIWAS